MPKHDESNGLTPVLTDAGRSAWLKAAADGSSCRITHLAVGTGRGESGYEVTADQSGLYSEMQRAEAKVQVEQHGEEVRAHVTAVISRGDGIDDPYEVHEIGLFIEDGTLFAVWATEGDDALLVKSPGTDLLLAFELVLPHHGGGLVNVSPASLFEFPQATADKPGVVRFATGAEVDAAQAEEIAVSPATLKFLNRLVLADGETTALIVGENGRVAIGSESVDPDSTLTVHALGEGAADDDETTYTPRRMLRLLGREDDTNTSRARLNFGDGDYVYIDEPIDDYLRIHGNYGVYVTTYGDSEQPGLRTDAESSPPRGIHLRSANVISATSSAQIKLDAGDEMRLRASAVVLGADDGSGLTRATGDFKADGRVKDRTGDVMPVGAMIAFGGREAPAGWIMCDGRAIPNDDAYDELRRVIGRDYTPDLRGRTLVGVAQQLILEGVQMEVPLHAQGGAPLHQLTVDEMPNHRHSIHNGDFGHHSRSFEGESDNDLPFETSPSVPLWGTDYAGGNGLHNNMQPYHGVNYIMKY